MSRWIAIIAGFAALLPALSFAAGPGHPRTGQTSFAAYEVRLEISRNGIHLGAPVARIVSGQSLQLELDEGGPANAILLQQRVRGFPGLTDHKALLELEFFGLQPGMRSERLLAPTFGIELGRTEVHHFSTERGVIRIRATVSGKGAGEADTDSAPQTFAYPSI
ncbi:MAG: hypothetical protein ACT4PG_07000 [Panacagrimonas sp.]